jgi:hypothetical protein
MSKPGSSTLSSSESLTSGGVDGADDGRTPSVGVVGVMGADLLSMSDEGARTVSSETCLRCAERPLFSSCFGRLSAQGFRRSGSASKYCGDGVAYGVVCTE